jgi:stage IV sporulation protein FA
VVFKGNKDEINNLVIVQSSDGFDIWYGLLENINVNIYDYINEGALIGSANKVFYLAITKDNKFYSYDEYKEIKNQS